MEVAVEVKASVGVEELYVLISVGLGLSVLSLNLNHSTIL